jgi:alkylated DNA repair protein alkB family protein 6
MSAFQPLHGSDQPPCSSSAPPLGLLSSIIYRPDFISDLEEASLINEITSCKLQFVSLNGRKALSVGGMVQSKGLIPTPLPSWAARLIAKLMEDDVSSWYEGSPNHMLVNRYAPGEGILPHEDGPAYHPSVVIVSLGAPAVLRFKPKEILDGGLVSVLLMPRSLVAFRGELYSSYLHYIEQTDTEKLDSSIINLSLVGQQVLEKAELERGGERISLTIRRIPRVIKGLSVGR